MRIHGLVACVDYAEFLALSIGRWTAGLASLTVVTAARDTETRELAEANGARVHATEAWYADGAAFNKGRALEEARSLMPWEDWILFLDADVIPPTDWLSVVKVSGPEVGLLHGCTRVQAERPEDWQRADLTPCAHDVPGVGFFQLFHASDPRAAKRPLLDVDWMHAGCYDSVFMHLWPSVKRIPLVLVHVGERENWWGRGNSEAFARMQAERKRRGGWQHERITRQE
jgi:hypothetical protein